MKHTIYFIIIVLSFTACKPNINTVENTVTTIETAVVTDSTITTIQAIEQSKEAPKLDLPFIGKRNFAFTDGVVNDNYITIKPDGMVLFSRLSVNFDKNNNPNGYKEEVYFKGKYSDVLKETPNGTIIVIKESADYTSYYKIEGDMIYMVDKNGLKDKNCGDEQNEVCGTGLEKI